MSVHTVSGRGIGCRPYVVTNIQAQNLSVSAWVLLNSSDYNWRLLVGEGSKRCNFIKGSKPPSDKLENHCGEMFLACMPG